MINDLEHDTADQASVLLIQINFDYSIDKQLHYEVWDEIICPFP